MKPLWVLSSASILFGLGHVYEGVFGFLATTALGFYFGFAFLKRRNIHEIAIAHGLYNFLVLLASLLR
jgi:membrane protease YdiL (CAAX protease family)